MLLTVVSVGRLHAVLLRFFDAAGAVIAAHPLAGAVVFVLLSALSAMLAFVSSAVLVPAALATWGRWACLLLLWVGWMLGGTGAWVTARYLGRTAVRRLASAATLARYEARVGAHASFGFILLFQLALPSEIPGYVLGLARAPLRRYLPALALAELPFAAGAVFLGEGFLARQLPLLAGVGALGVALSVWAFHTLHRRLAR